MDYSEKEIVEGLVKGDRYVINALYDEYEQKIQRYVLANSGNKEEGADLWHETLIVVIEKIRSETFKAGNIRGFITRVSRNIWLKKLRIQKRNRVIAEKIEEPVYEYPEDEWGDPVWEDLVIQVVGEKFHQLNKACKDILNLKYDAKKSHKEIAEILSITADSARTKLSRCMQKLKSLCGNDPHFPLLN